MGNDEKEKVFVPEVISESSKALSIEEFSNKWKDFQDFVKSQLKDGVDYGKVPGIAKPFLMLPGAQKIMSRYITRPEYEIINSIENWDRGLFSFQIKCVLRLMSDGRVVGQGIGSCNSFEEKYRYIWVTEKKLEGRKPLAQRTKKGRYGVYTEYKLERKDLASIHNTILKMAKKRAVVDASLTLSNASEYFTQDIEDTEVVEEETPETKNRASFKQHFNPPITIKDKSNGITPKQIKLINELYQELNPGRMLDISLYKTEEEADVMIFKLQLAQSILSYRKEGIGWTAEAEEQFKKKYTIADWSVIGLLARNTKELGLINKTIHDFELANKPEKIEPKKRTKAEKIQLIKDKIEELNPYGVFNVSQLVSLDGKTLDKILREEFGESE